MLTTKGKEIQRQYRHARIRKKISGDTQRPRLYVHRSLQNFSAQIIDDSAQKVLCGISTLSKEFRSKIKYGGNIKAAAALGKVFADIAKKKGITKVSFDRGGFKYHGRVKAFADAAREGGLEF